jgi:Flavin reductase like domain
VSSCRPKPDRLSFDFATLPQAQRYKLLVGLVVPRPIALVTSLGPGGIVNAAPFSFFNVFSEEPPLVVLGLQSKADGSIKGHTGQYSRDRNLRRQFGWTRRWPTA